MLFKRICFAWAIILALLALQLAGRSAPPSAPAPAPKTSTAQPWSSEQYRDFMRRVIEACDRLPVGDRNRPSEAVCRAPR